MFILNYDIVTAEEDGFLLTKKVLYKKDGTEVVLEITKTPLEKVEDIDKQIKVLQERRSILTKK